MKVIVLYRPHSEHRAMVDEFIRQYQRLYPESKLDVIDVDSRDGATIAQTYAIVSYPAVMVMRDDGNVVESWQGDTELPKVEDVRYYAAPPV
ncbi:hypothetical protein M1512_01580 [Patescibacteria group bacterium]|nr:hypothetical protein [Patescibacteria group bacterium]